MDHLLGPFSRFFTCRLRSDPHVLNLKRAQKFVYHFTQSRFCSLLTTVFLTLPSALSQGASERRGILWRWRGPSGIRWVWRNGRGPHLEGRQEPQASSPFRTPTRARTLEAGECSRPCPPPFGDASLSELQWQPSELEEEPTGSSSPTPQ